MVHLTTSTKERDQIVDDNGFTYSFKRLNEEEAVWVCRVEDCRGQGRTPINYVNSLHLWELTTLHNHISDYDRLIRQLLISKMKIILRTTLLSPRDVVNKVMFGRDREMVRILGDLEHVYRTLRRYSEKLLNPKPIIFPELGLSHLLSVTGNGEAFYQYGPENYDDYVVHDDICLFFSKEMINILAKKPIMSVDGTFTVVPAPYYQLYTICYLEENHGVPCVFAFLKNKEQSTYVKLFALLKEMVGTFATEVIKTDFEYAAISALQQEFPNSRVSGCLFHLSQALLRKVNENGLYTLYRTNRNVKKFVKALLGLAFSDLDMVDDLFVQLEMHEDFPPALRPIYNYFYSTYVNPSGARFPVELWHCRFLVDNNIPKTNNAIEAYHNNLKKSFSSNRYSFIGLVHRIKVEEDAARLKSYRLEMGYRLRRNKKYVRIETELEEYLEENPFGRTTSFIFDIVNIIFY